MTDPVFDKEGNLSNLDELTREEVAVAYSAKNKEIFGRIGEKEASIKQLEADKAKAEADLVEARKSKPEEKAPAADPEELRLIARGLSDDEINEAKDIAKGKGITLLEALKTPIFQTFQQKLKDDKKKEDAKLGGAGGSPQSAVVEGIKAGTEFKSEEEAKAAHKNVWKDAVKGKPAA